MIILDTNVVSEWVNPRPNPGVVAWLSEVDEDRVFLSVITLAELRYGRRYDFRVRMVDTTGGGPALGDSAFRGGEAPVARLQPLSSLLNEAPTAFRSFGFRFRRGRPN